MIHLIMYCFSSDILDWSKFECSYLCVHVFIRMSHGHGERERDGMWNVDKMINVLLVVCSFVHSFDMFMFKQLYYVVKSEQQQQHQYYIYTFLFTSFNRGCIIWAMFTHLVNPSRTQIELIYVFISTK